MRFGTFLATALLSGCSIGMYGPQPGIRPPGPDSLNEAARHGNLQKVKELLDADPHRINRLAAYDGETPVLSAAAGGQVAVIEYLIARGANVNAEKKYGENAFQLAAISMWPDALDTLVSHGAKPKLAFGDKQILGLIAGGAGRSSCKRVTDTSRLLLRFGADVNGVFARDPIRTPLTEAAINSGCPDTVALLLSNGADANLGNPLTKYRWFPRNDARGVEIEQLLLKYGARE